MLEFTCELKDPSKVCGREGYEYGHMAFVGELGHLTSKPDPNNPHYEPFMAIWAIHDLLSGLRKLLESDIGETFMLYTIGNPFTLKVWFVKKPDGMVAVMSFPEPGFWSKIMKAEKLQRYKDHLERYPGVSKSRIISILSWEDLVRAVSKGVLEFADQLVTRAPDGTVYPDALYSQEGLRNDVKMLQDKFSAANLPG